LIADRTPDQLKLKFALWTREVSELIEAVYGVRLTMRNTGKYLKRWVFTPQRPLKKAYEQSPEAVGKWLNEEYSKIAAKAQVEGAEIEWGDKTAATRRKGKHRWRMPTRGAKKRSVISTVTNKGQMRWKVFSGALNAKVLIGFLDRLVRHREQKIILILDNMRVHHSKPVKKWLAEHMKKIEIFYLLSYSPELNPNELLNADLK
jgi:hypothetical protein